jgi:hypothetical protein
MSNATSCLHERVFQTQSVCWRAVVATNVLESQRPLQVVVEAALPNNHPLAGVLRFTLSAPGCNSPHFQRALDPASSNHDRE